MPYFVYILHSEKLNKFYTGTTNDPGRRLTEHNSAAYPDSFTVRGIPWTIFLLIECIDSTNAYDFEKFIKKMKSAAFIRKLKEEPQIIQSIIDQLKNT